MDIYLDHVGGMSEFKRKAYLSRKRFQNGRYEKNLEAAGKYMWKNKRRNKDFMEQA